MPELWSERYKALKQTCRKQGISVRKVPDNKTKDYVGMNDLAAKPLGYKMAKKTIYIDKNLSTRAKAHTLNHEMIERDLMRKGKTYWQAHKVALKKETHF